MAVGEPEDVRPDAASIVACDNEAQAHATWAKCKNSSRAMGLLAPRDLNIGTKTPISYLVPFEKAEGLPTRKVDLQVWLHQLSGCINMGTLLDRARATSQASLPMASLREAQRHLVQGRAISPYSTLALVLIYGTIRSSSPSGYGLVPVSASSKEGSAQTLLSRYFAQTKYPIDPALKPIKKSYHAGRFGSTRAVSTLLVFP